MGVDCTGEVFTNAMVALLLGLAAGYAVGRHRAWLAELTAEPVQPQSLDDSERMRLIYQHQAEMAALGIPPVHFFDEEAAATLAESVRRSWTIHCHSRLRAGDPDYRPSAGFIARLTRVFRP